MITFSHRKISLLESIIALMSGVLLAYRGGQFVSESVTKFSLESDVSHFFKKGFVAQNAPLIQSDKESPYRRYTAKIFRNSLNNMSSVHLDQEETCQENGDGTYDCEFVHRPNGPDEEEEMTSDLNKDDDVHLPAGQHLLVDIKNVNSDFLNSEVRLAQAMIDVVNESQLTLLSYHCHRLSPMGVSCVGVLLESHISFHTWPADGVISLDLFTCGSGLLVPVIPLIKKLFALPREMVGEDDHLEKPIVLWVRIIFVYIKDYICMTFLTLL